MENFTPYSAIAGGLLIGLSAAVLWVANGRIAGISGIVGGLMSGAGGERLWRLAFLAGLLVAPVVYMVIEGEPSVTSNAGTATLILAGLLVGFGTRLGGGCTSGHGVCGIARLSPRSITATILFMAAAAVTVFVTRHVVGG